MTLLVGIRCKDGVVMAADQAVTFGTSPQNFTVSHLACKISVLKGGLIIAGTGQVGAKQRFCETAEKKWREIAGQGKTAVEMCRALSEAAQVDFGSTGMEKGTFGALVAFPNTKGGPQLCEFGVAGFQPELKDAGSWFVSMGSGQLIADSYLVFMRDVFWKSGMPLLKQGVFAAAWVMRQSIRVAPGFIREPIDIAVLQGDKAQMIDKDELQLHMSVADQATEYFGRFDPTDLPPNAAGEEPMPGAPPMPEPPRSADKKH
jgi:Proteasome subunit